jgi:hypothetical protein
MVSPEERSWCETHSLGHEFLLAANYLNSDSRPSHLAPTFVLYIHAIEMALKSYLLRKGLTKHQLQRISVSAGLNPRFFAAVGLGRT